MTAEPESRQRRSVRLRGYDYTQVGAYFLTICARDRACLFADISEDGAVRLSTVGQIVTQCWEAIPEHFPAVAPDAFVVMPNHLHGILVLEGRVVAVGTACRAPTGLGGANGPDLPLASRVERFGAPVAGSIPTIVRSFKAAVTKALNDDPGRGTACRAFLSDFGPLPPERISSP